jgi:DNA-binding YbaB/EbfC family protein
MNIQKMLKQFQQMQSQMQKTQADLGSKTFEGSVAGGKVVAVANGHGDVQSIRLDREVVDPAEVEMLQDLVLAAVQQAQKKSKDSQAAEMGKITGGLGLPPGMGF